MIALLEYIAGLCSITCLYVPRPSNNNKIMWSLVIGTKCGCDYCPFWYPFDSVALVAKLYLLFLNWELVILLSGREQSEYLLESIMAGQRGPEQKTKPLYVAIIKQTQVRVDTGLGCTG